MIWDVLIVGGGPAGLAAAIECASRGLGTLLIERGPVPPDKACGEGLAPRGVRALGRLGALEHLAAEDCAAIAGIRFVQPDGPRAEGRFRAGPGLGVRRTALAAALARRAQEAGATLHFGEGARGWRRAEAAVEIETDGGAVAGRLLVLADGLNAGMRRPESLRLRGEASRYGMRRHFRLPPWSRFVEVHWGEGLEAYVTPAGAERVGVALLWDKRRQPCPASFDRMLARFPELTGRLRGAPIDSSLRGAGPVGRRAGSVVTDRIALLGDAAGSVDPITGEGLSLAFECAASLGQVAGEAIVRGAPADALGRYQADFAAAHRRAGLFARALLLLARHPGLRRGVVRGLAASPNAFEWLLGLAAEPASRLRRPSETNLEARTRPAGSHDRAAGHP